MPAIFVVWLFVVLSPFCVYVMLPSQLILLLLFFLSLLFLLCSAVTDTCFVLNYADVGM